MNTLFKYSTKQRVGKSNLITGLLLGSVLVLLSCSKSSSVNSELDLLHNTDDLLNPNISFQISYDQKSMVFTPFWSEDVVAGFKSKSASEDTEMLTDYDHTKEYVAFDQDRNMILQVDYLEGTRSQGMPDDLYSEVTTCPTEVMISKWLAPKLEMGLLLMCIPMERKSAMILIKA